MEMGFKHSSNQIKLEAYNCWGGLIANFALDKGKQNHEDISIAKKI